MSDGVIIPPLAVSNAAIGRQNIAPTTIPSGIETVRRLCGCGKVISAQQLPDFGRNVLAVGLSGKPLRGNAHDLSHLLDRGGAHFGDDGTHGFGQLLGRQLPGQELLHHGHLRQLLLGQIGTVLLAGTLDMELIPAADEGVVAVTVNFRSGTTLEKEDEALKLWEQIAEEEPDVEFYSVSISGSSATLTADLIKKRTLTTAQIVDKWNEIAAGMTDMDVTVTSSGSSMSSMMSTSSYEIDLQGNDRAELAQAAEDLQAEIEKIDGVVKTENSLVNSTTLAKVVVDPLKAMQYLSLIHI